MLTVEERYDWALHTLKECGEFLLSENDETVGYLIFEEFCVDVFSFLSDENLQLFIGEQIISEAVGEKCRRLRSRADKAFSMPELWGVWAVKSAREWLEILRLSDEIKADILSPIK